MTQLAQVTSRRRDGVLVVRLEGEIDLSNAARVGAAVLDAAGSSAALVVDRADVTFLDSTGAGLLVRLSSLLGRAGVRHAYVVPAAPRGLRAAELLGFSALLPLEASEEEALRRVGRRSPARAVARGWRSSARSSGRRMAGAAADWDAGGESLRR